MFLVEGFPGVGFVEEKIEEASVVFLAKALSLVVAEFRPRVRWSEAAKKSIDDSSCVEQVFERAECCRGCAPMPEVVRARPGRSNRQESAIYCRRARSEREETDLSDASPRKR